MKTVLLLLVGIALISPLAYAEGITVSSPSLNKTWCIGKTYDIKWSWQGLNTGKKVRLQLVNPSTHQNLSVIATDEADDGVYPWKVPSNLAEGNYQIKVRIIGEEVNGFSPTFTINKCSGNSGIFVAVNKQKLVAIKMNITVTSPAANSYWDGGKTKTIKWETGLKKPMKIELYKYNGKTFVAKIAEGLSNYPADGKWSYQWAIPTTVGPAAFKIKVSTMDNVTSDFSDKFFVRQDLGNKTYTLAAVTSNKYKYKKKSKKEFTVAPKIFDDPGAGKARVGYNNYSSDHTDYAVVYRSHLAFNLASCQGKGLLLKARLKFSHFMGCDTPIRVYVLDQAWNGDASALFSIPCSLVSDPANITQFIQKWLGKPEENYGIVLVGPNESMSYNNSECVGYYENIKLELEFLSANN